MTDQKEDGHLQKKYDYNKSYIISPLFENGYQNFGDFVRYTIRKGKEERGWIPGIVLIKLAVE